MIFGSGNEVRRDDVNPNRYNKTEAATEEVQEEISSDIDIVVQPATVDEAAEPVDSVPEIPDKKEDDSVGFGGIFFYRKNKEDDSSFSQDTFESSMEDKTVVSFESSGVQKNNLEGLSKSQLNEELVFSKNQLTEKENILSAIQDDSEPSIKLLHEEIEKSHKNYTEALQRTEKGLLTEYLELNKQINNNQAELKRAESDISAKESEISSKTSDYESVVESVGIIEKVLDYLSSSKDDNGIKSKFAKFISPLTRQLESARQLERVKKLSLEHSKKELEKLKGRKNRLENKDKELNAKQRKFFFGAVSKYSHLEKLQSNYEKAKEIYNSEKAKAISIATADVQEARNYVKEIENALKNVTEVEGNFSSTTIPQNASTELSIKFGLNSESEIEEFCKKLNCPPEKLLEILSEDTPL